MHPPAAPLPKKSLEQADEVLQTSLPQGQWVRIAVSCAVVLSTLSLSSISVALPVIANDLGLTPATSIWVISCFQLSLVSTIFPFSSLGEQLGYRRIFLTGLFLLIAASIICSIAQSFETLLTGRILQGLGASAVMAVNPALIRLSVPASELGRVLGTNAMLVAIATAIGPSIAAVVLSLDSWRWLFALNLPLAFLALGLGIWAMDGLPSPQTRRFDVWGAALNICAFLLIVSSIDRLAYSYASAALQLFTGLVCLVLLARHQRHQPAPILPLDLLTNPTVRYCVGSSIFAFAAQMVALIATPFMLHLVLGLEMLATGMTMTTWPLAVALMAPIAGRLVDHKVPSAALCVLGSVILCTSLIFMNTNAGTLTTTKLVVTMAIAGIGFGFFQTPNNRSMLASTPRARSGSAGGLQATARLMGQTLGAAIVGISFTLTDGDTLSACSGAFLAGGVSAVLSAGFSMWRMIKRKKGHESG